MALAVRTQATVQADGKVEICSDELPEGAAVEVIVVVEADQSDRGRKKNLVDFIGAAKGSFESAAEIDAYIREERDSWNL